LVSTATTGTTGTTGGTTGGMTTTTIAYTKVEGSLSVVAAGLTKDQIEAASKTSLALHFAVDASKVTATATETRRLAVDGNDRRLKGTWTIAYSMQVTAAQVTAVKTKVATAASAPDAFKAALATNFKAALKTAGVSATVADALTVSSATATHITPVSTSGSTTGTGSASGASETVAFLSFIIVMKTLFFSV